MKQHGRYEEFAPTVILLALLSACIIVVDYCVELSFPFLLRVMPVGLAFLAGPLFLALLVFPLLLLYVVRPMRQQIKMRERAQADLQSLADKLELKVQEQTATLRTEISERKKVEESLQLFRTLMDHSDDAIEIIHHTTAAVIDVNETSCKQLGYTREELLSLKVFDFDPLVDESSYNRMVEKLRQLGSMRIESVHRRKDGTTFPVEITLSYVLLGSDYTVCVVRDITERVRAEEERKRLEMAIENAAEGVMITNVEGAITYVNPAFEQITGYTRAEVAGQNPRILNSGRQDKAYYAQLWETISAGDVWRGNITNKRKDGRLYQEEATISPVRDNHGNVIAYVAIKRDITKQLSLEAQVRQSQKMEAIGVLAAGIAHDFNNILSAILGYTQLAMIDTEKGKDSIANHLEHVEKASLRARDLVQHILTFSRQSESVLRPVRLDHVINEVLKLLRASLPRSIEFRNAVDDLEDPVLADSSQIHQIIMNLCTNAAHAMRENGGILEVSLSAMDIDENTPKASLDLQPGRWARISVSDTGHGMDTATMERIFEPFYTTKQEDGGTGLGLSTVHGIVKQHGGTITVYSEPGEGTVFHVYLPISRVTDNARAEYQTAVPRGHGEHILIVDDEEAVADMASEMLTRLGYTVTVRTSPIDALEAFRAQPEKFDLVLTDQAMPQMNGQKLTSEIKRIRPGTIVVVATGYGGRIDEKALGIASVLWKPFLFQDLAVAIDAALQGRQATACVDDRGTVAGVTHNE